MKDFGLKARILTWMLREAYDNWQQTVAFVDLDGLYCCDGRQCCCGGATHRQMWNPNHDN